MSGRLTPFLLEMRPATSTIVSARPGATLRHAQQHLAVVDQHAVAGLGANREFPDAADRRASGCPGVGSESSVNGVALAQLHAAGLEFADPQLRPLQIDENADRAIEFLFERADHRDALAHRVVRGVAHVDAEDVGAGLEQAARSARSAEAGPSVAMILMRRRRRPKTSSKYEIMQETQRRAGATG